MIFFNQFIIMYYPRERAILVIYGKILRYYIFEKLISLLAFDHIEIFNIKKKNLFI